MSIKSDNWIRRMAVEHGMIDPFEPGQVRERRGARIVSFGTSSYGYDVRCADDFKIFTNINSTIVDPKNFDERSFVDFKGSCCVIPPNSFVLARTVEYFRIPRSILTICLGKCVTGDTRVIDVESGAYLPITEFAWGKQTLGMRDWRLEPARVSAFLRQGCKSVYQVTTQAGLKIRATANHPFRQLHGWTALSNLRCGDRIAVARHLPVFGHTPIPDWEVILLGLLIAEHQQATWCCDGEPGRSDPALVDLFKRCVIEGRLDRHAPWQRSDAGFIDSTGPNDEGESRRNTAWLARYGVGRGAETGCVPQAVFTAPRSSVRNFLRALFSGRGGRCQTGGSVAIEYQCGSRRLVEDIHHLLLRFGIFSTLHTNQVEPRSMIYHIRIADPDQIRFFAREVGFWPGSLKQVQLEREILPAVTMRPAGLPISASASATQVGATATGVCGGNAEAVRCAWRDDFTPLLDGPVWDIVESIHAAGDEEVYDLTVPGLHNFVANDMIVHNSTYARCGIIVNVTPLEPEWEGHVTLEFSNTTPLPAKIYADEGVAQMLFLESDELCETSYRDRGGKYQGQKGVTLPKT